MPSQQIEIAGPVGAPLDKNRNFSKLCPLPVSIHEW
jgi:hypothetical protein